MIIALFSLLFSTFFLFSSKNVDTSPNQSGAADSELVHQKEDSSNTQVSDSILKTGWYFIVDTSGYKRNLDKTDEFYFIDPVPIGTAKNITELEIYSANDGTFGLLMRLDATGTIAWSTATEKATGRRLAFVLNNKLLHTPYVNAQITGGITALNRGDYSKLELENFKRIIVSQH